MKKLKKRNISETFHVIQNLPKSSDNLVPEVLNRGLAKTSNFVIVPKIPLFGKEGLGEIL
jgi:radical SAM superfamily enzyme